MVSGFVTSPELQARICLEEARPISMASKLLMSIKVRLPSCQWGEAEADGGCRVGRSPLRLRLLGLGLGLGVVLGDLELPDVDVGVEVDVLEAVGGLAVLLGAVPPPPPPPRRPL